MEEKLPAAGVRGVAGPRVFVDWRVRRSAAGVASGGAAAKVTRLRVRRVCVVVPLLGGAAPLTEDPFVWVVIEVRWGLVLWEVMSVAVVWVWSRVW